MRNRTEKSLVNGERDNQTEAPQVTIGTTENPFLALESFLKANEENTDEEAVRMDRVKASG